MIEMTEREKPWQKAGTSKREAVQSMFAEIASGYDALNTVMSLALHHRWRKYAVSKLQLSAGDQALDVCCGTGDFMSPLQQAVGQSGNVVGIDFCLPMLQVAAKKNYRNISLGDACLLPVQSNTFSAVSVGWGIRNVPDIDAAHQELARVLKPGGRFVSLDMAQPKNPLVRKVSQTVFNTFIPLLGKLTGKSDAYTYLPKSTEKFMDREALCESMRKAGFTNTSYKDLFFGNICVHWGTKA